MRWGRIIAFGALAGIVWTFLSAIVLGSVGAEFVAALPPRSTRVQLYLLATNLAAAVWALWLYASIRAQYQPGLKTAAIAGVAWWVIQSMQSSKWVVLGTVPLGVAWPPALGTLPAMIVATALGAWCYDNYRGLGEGSEGGPLPEMPPAARSSDHGDSG